MNLYDLSALYNKWASVENVDHPRGSTGNSHWLCSPNLACRKHVKSSLLQRMHYLSDCVFIFFHISFVIHSLIIITILSLIYEYMYSQQLVWLKGHDFILIWCSISSRITSTKISCFIIVHVLNFFFIIIKWLVMFF